MRRHAVRLPERRTVTIAPPSASPKGNTMLQTIAIILVILWLLGLVTSTTMGGFIHVLLVIALVIILVRVIQGRRPV